MLLPTENRFTPSAVTTKKKINSIKTIERFVTVLAFVRCPCSLLTLRHLNHFSFYNNNNNNNNNNNKRVLIGAFCTDIDDYNAGRV